MKAVTVQPGVAGSVRFEEVPEPARSWSRRRPSASAERTSRSPRAPTAGRPPGGTGSSSATSRSAGWWIPGRADRAWLARLISRRVPPQNIADALQRGPDDIKVVVDFGG